MGERITVAQRRGEVVRRLGPEQRVDDGWEAIEQTDGMVKVPEGVTIIAEKAFWLRDMSAVILPDSIRHIGPRAFLGCIYLKTLRLPATYETIGEYAFEDADLEGDIPAFPTGDPDDPFRSRIIGENAFSSYWEKHRHCPRCGYPLGAGGICIRANDCEKDRMELCEGVCLFGAAQETTFTKACTPDGDTRLSDNRDLDFDAAFSDKAYGMDELILRSRALQTCMISDCGSHSMVQSSWNEAVSADVKIKDHKATVTLPFIIDTPVNREHLIFSYGLVPENGIAEVLFNTTYGSCKTGKSVPQEQILIAGSDLGGEIFVCDHCRCVKEPHFCFRMPSGDRMYLHMEDNGACDDPGDFEMRDRRDLQNTLRHPGVWREIIRQWNRHNPVKVSANRHIPFYVDTPVHGEKGHWYTDPLILKGARVCVILDDEDPRPHFHYMRGDGCEARILFEEPEYLEPSAHLNLSEKEDLARFLQKRRIPKYDFGDNIYGELIAIWEADSGHERVNKGSSMPDYRLLPNE